MTEQETAERMAALEQARAQIEIALSTNADWLAFRRASGASRLLAERALAGNPLYRSWDLLNEAIQDLHARRQGEAGGDDLTRIRAFVSADAKTSPEDARHLGRPGRNIELGDILESLRNDAALRGSKPPAVALSVERAAAADVESPPLRGQEQPPAELVDSAPGLHGVGVVAFEPEEATVTFVIKEPLLPAPGLPSEHDLPRAPRPADSAARSDAARLQAPAEDQGAEAEVEIVSGPKNRASGAASPKR